MNILNILSPLLLSAHSHTIILSNSPYLTLDDFTKNAVGHFDVIFSM